MSTAAAPPTKKSRVIGREIQQRNALVIRGEEPRLHAIIDVQIVLTGHGSRWTHRVTFLGACPWSPSDRM